MSVVDHRCIDRKMSTWFDLVGELVASPTGGFPRELLSAELHRSFGANVAWNWLDPGTPPGFTLHVPIPGWPAPDALRDMASGVPQHPLVRWFAASGDDRPMSIGRVPAAMHTAEGRRLRRDHLAPVGLEEQLSIPYRLGPSHHRAFVMGRTGRDFHEEEMELARQVQPLLKLVDRQSRVLQRCPAAAGEVGLSGREVAVVRLLADGLTASAIGSRLGISPRTVHRHLGNAYRKLGVADRVRAVLVAAEAGLLEEEDDRFVASDVPAV